MAEGDVEAPAAALPDAAAIHAALSGTSESAEARAFLERQSVVAAKQAQLLDLQIEDMKREDSVRHWSMRVRHVSDVMKLAFEFAVAAILLAVVVLVAAAVWNAAHDDGLVIEAFSVPPDMAARGLTGQAVAAQLQDKLTAMQDATDSARPANSYANNWGDDIKVQIPDTGVSIGEFYRILVRWLGHETYITGEVYRDGDGVAIVARAGANGGAAISGKDADFGKLMQQAAEAIYARTQPYRYSVYLQSHGQTEKSIVLMEALTRQGPALDRAWAWLGLATIDDFNDPLHSNEKERKANSLVPDFPLPLVDLSFDEGSLGHDEASLAVMRRVLPLLQGPNIYMTERARRISLATEEFSIPAELGDFPASIRYSRQADQLPDYSGMVENAFENIVVCLTLLHDPAAERDAVRDLPQSSDPALPTQRAMMAVTALYWLHDWSGVIGHLSDFENAQGTLITFPGYSPSATRVIFTRQTWPYIATALAMTGNFRAAHAMIDQTPRDCYTCLRNRGDIAAAEKNWHDADYWFGEAVRAAPSIPIAYSDWGRVLLSKGDTGAAIAKFDIANRKGPHFADPLEMWGEALIRQNRSDLALAKFEEADKYAPNWGRLHLKWGEALVWSGKNDDARKQFVLAADLDLASSEKSELARMRSLHG